MESRVAFEVEGQVVRGDLRLPREGAPCVAMCHGLEGDKDGVKWRALAEALEEAGMASLRFNFRGCGHGPEASGGRFEESSLSGRVADLRAALRFLEGRGVDGSRLGLIGSSFGGMVAIAAGEAGVRARVLLATPLHLKAATPAFAPGRQEFELPSGQRLGRGWYEDTASYDMERLLAVHDRPTLVVQGDADDLVPVEHARALHRAAPEPRRLEVIPGGTHTLDTPPHLGRVTELAVDWLRAYL